MDRLTIEQAFFGNTIYGWTSSSDEGNSRIKRIRFTGSQISPGKVAGVDLTRIEAQFMLSMGDALRVALTRIGSSIQVSEDQIAHLIENVKEAVKEYFRSEGGIFLTHHLVFQIKEEQESRQFFACIVNSEMTHVLLNNSYYPPRGNYVGGCR